MANPSTLANLRHLVRANTGVIEDPNFTDTLLDRWINDAQRDVQLKLFHLGYTEFKSSDTLSLTAAKYSSATNNINTAPLSSDCPNRMGVPNWLLQVDVNDSGGGGANYGVAYPISPRDFKEHLANTFLAPTVKKPACVILDDKLYLAPVDIDVAIAHYYKEVTDMASDAGTLDLPEAYGSFVVRAVELRIADRQGKLQDKQSAMVELDKSLKDAFQALQIQKVEEPSETVVLQ